MNLLYVVLTLPDRFPTLSSLRQSFGPRGLIQGLNEAAARNNDNNYTPPSIHPGQESKYIHHLTSERPGK